MLSLFQGEGETKIIKRINSSTDGSHVIVGNDSDIILMSLMCPVRQLYILAQQTRGKNSHKYSCISLDALHLPQRPTPEELEAIAAVVSWAVLCCAVLCRAGLCCAVPCRVVPCFTVPCCAVLCCVVLCCAVP